MKKNTTQSPSNVPDVAASLPWDKVTGIASKDQVVKKYMEIPEETYQFALDKENRDQVVQSALKSLQATDPENATHEQAEILADKMEIFAKMALEEADTLKKKPTE